MIRTGDAPCVRDSEGQNSAKDAEEIRWNAEMFQDIRYTLEDHTGEICTSCSTKHVYHGENDRCSWTDGQL